VAAATGDRWRRRLETGEATATPGGGGDWRLAAVGAAGLGAWRVARAGGGAAACGLRESGAGWPGLAAGRLGCRRLAAGLGASRLAAGCGWID
jgi:hypothetical protein